MGKDFLSDKYDAEDEDDVYEEVYDYDFYDELKDGLCPAIKRWYSDDELRIVIVEGTQGYGKSTYACQIAAEVYGTWQWNILKNYLAYDPEELLSRIEDKRKKSPLLIWDDAGNWLNANDYRKKWVKEASKYFQVARDDWGCMILTTVDAEDIANRIRNMNNRILVQITKRGKNVRQPYRRTARIFTKWKTPDKTRSGETNVIEERFKARMDDTFYGHYRVYRHGFNIKAKKRMREEAR